MLDGFFPVHRKPSGLCQTAAVARRKMPDAHAFPLLGDARHIGQISKLMNMWPDRRVLELFGIQLPIIQAPMAGANLSELAIAVSGAGGLGSLPCALLSLEQARSELERIRAQTRSEEHTSELQSRQYHV